MGARQHACAPTRTLLPKPNATPVPSRLSVMKQSVGAGGTLNTGNAGAKPGAHASTWCGVPAPFCSCTAAGVGCNKLVALMRKQGQLRGRGAAALAQGRKTREAIMQADTASVNRVHTSRQPFRPAALHACHRLRGLAAVDVRIRGIVNACFGSQVRIFRGRTLDRHDRQRLHGGSAPAASGTEFRGELSLQVARSMAARLPGFSP